MQVTLIAFGEILGTADWAILPVKGDVIGLQNNTGLTEVRRVDEIEDSPSGVKIVTLGAPQPTFVYNR